MSPDPKPTHGMVAVSVLFSEPKIPQFLQVVLRHFLNGQFQCSSASRKFLNAVAAPCQAAPRRVSVLFSEPKIPQSAPASRRRMYQTGFSALQRAENSSIVLGRLAGGRSDGVSVLFSEPKIPQSRPSHLRPSIFPTAMITLRHS